MSQNHPSLERAPRLSLWMAGWLALGVQLAPAESVVLHLRNGDRVAGVIVAEDTNHVVLATSWIKELPVPLSAIQRRELVTNAVPAAAVVETKPTPPTAPIATAPPPATLPVAGSNVVAAAKPASPPTLPAPASAPKPPKPKRWKTNLGFGTDLQFGAHDRQLYLGRLKLTYERPYTSDPKKFFRSIFDYAANYEKTDGVTSADDMYGTAKTDFDVGRRIYVYNLVGVGYDEIRKIDLQYEFGPGAGYHLFMHTNFVMNVECGLSYQVQERSSSQDVQNYYYRLAEDITWKITSRLTLVEKAEFLPRAEDLNTYRVRLDATLSYVLWQNITLNLSVLDLYDTSPAQGVDNNELSIRSLLGITF